GQRYSGSAISKRPLRARLRQIVGQKTGSGVNSRWNEGYNARPFFLGPGCFMFKLLHISLLLFGALFQSSARAESVLFLNPGSTQEAFWVSYSQFMQAAAQDLGIDLQILYSQRQPEL